MPVIGSDVERRDGLMPLTSRVVERRATVLSLKIDVTASKNELFRDGRMPILGRAVERREPIRVLVLDEGLRAFCRQQRANFRCITITRGIPKLLLPDLRSCGTASSLPASLPSLSFGSCSPWRFCS